MDEKLAVSSAGLRRDLEILEVLAGHGDGLDTDGFGVSWIAQRLGREKSQVSRALRALEAEGMVERDPLTRRYHLGWRLFALASRTQQARLVQVSAPFLRRLPPGARASAQMRAEYRRLTARYGRPRELPAGYTLVREHTRGG